MTEQIERLISRDLNALPDTTHGFFTRRGGVSRGVYASLNCGIGSGDDRAAISKNRDRVAAAFEIDSAHLVSPVQVHGTDAAVIKDVWRAGERPTADALVTAERGLAIGVGTADCAPILFADSEGGVIGAAHAGWGGTIEGILEATIDAMISIGARPDRIVAAIGPTITQESYEVGPEFRDRFLAEDPINGRFFVGSERPKHHRFDLVGYIQARLDRIGINEVDRVGGDTYADDTRFFSFRRATHRGESDYGRMMSAIALS